MAGGAVRWVTKLVNRKGKQFRQRYKVAAKVAKKLGKRVAKQAKKELKEFRKVRARAAKKAARAKGRTQKRQQKKAPETPKTPPAWRELLIEGRRKWIRLGAGGAGSLGDTAQKKALAMRTLARRQAAGHRGSERPADLGKWQKTVSDSRSRKHKDYAAPHKPKARRQG